MTRTIERLRRAHLRLKAELERERQAKRPDDTRMKQLKRLKLAIKDRLHRLVPAHAR